jgi:hypothetical protein
MDEFESMPIHAEVQALMVGGPFDGRTVVNEPPLPFTIEMPERRNGQDDLFGSGRDPWRGYRLQTSATLTVSDPDRKSFSDAVREKSVIARRSVRFHLYRLDGCLYRYVGWSD